MFVYIIYVAFTKKLRTWIMPLEEYLTRNNPSITQHFWNFTWKVLVAEIILYDSQASCILIMLPGTIVAEPDT